MYLALVAALFVRFVDPEGPHAHGGRVPTAAELRPEHLALVRWHHRVFYLLLAMAPLEWLWRGRPASWGQGVAAVVFALGVFGYRRAGRTLGDVLSPLIAPREPATLVTHGAFRRVRHPMYRAEIAMAFGAPLTLGASLGLLLGLIFSWGVLRRIGVEEAVLAERLPAYRDYAQRTKRLVPYVY